MQVDPPEHVGFKIIGGCMSYVLSNICRYLLCGYFSVYPKNII